MGHSPSPALRERVAPGASPESGEGYHGSWSTTGRLGGAISSAPRPAVVALTAPALPSAAERRAAGSVAPASSRVKNATAGDDLLSIDEHIAHGAVGRMIDERTQRIADRPHLRALEVEQHEIGLHPGREAADIVAHQRRRAADRRGMEQIFGRHRR